jgi:hypothetical protein
MNESGRDVAASIRMITNILFGAICLVVIMVGNRYPLLTAGMAVLPLGVGIAGFVVAAFASRRYQNVFDYELAEFWGRQRNGKSIRGIIVTIIMIAVWCFALAIVMLLFSLPVIF